MNAQRRKQLKKVIDALENIIADIDYVAEEEREAFDNMPESLQDTDKAIQMNENADNLEQASCDLQDIIDIIEDIINS